MSKLKSPAVMDVIFSIVFGTEKNGDRYRKQKNTLQNDITSFKAVTINCPTVVASQLAFAKTFSSTNVNWSEASTPYMNNLHSYDILCCKDLLGVESGLLTTARLQRLLVGSFCKWLT